MVYSQILTVCTHNLHIDLALIRLVDMSFSGIFSDLSIHTHDLHIDLALIRLVDMSFNGMFQILSVGTYGI